MTVCFNRQIRYNKPMAGVQITRLLERLGLETILNQTRETRFSYNPTCSYCSRLKKLTESNQESSLETVRQLIIELYPNIFQYQVWDLQSGMPVLHQVFLQSVQLNPFTYLCHVTCNFGQRGWKLQCSDIDKDMSVCNVAVVNAVCRTLLGRSFSLERRRELELKWEQVRVRVLEWVRERVRLRVLEWVREREMKGEQKAMQELKWDLKWELVQELKLELIQKLDQMREQELRELKWELEQDVSREVEQELEQELEREVKQVREWERNRELMRQQELVRQQMLELERELLELRGEILVSSESIKEFGNKAFEVGVWINIPKGFQDLVYKINRDILICMSPQRKWIIEADSFLKMCVLSRGQQEKHSCNDDKPEHKISEVVRFTFTNDDLYFVYWSVRSLHALSLQTGTIFTSVSGCNLFYFTRERQDSGNDQHFYVWDIQEKVMSASFKSPAFLTVECCCCLSSSTPELILCGEYAIEIWEYTKPSCRLLTRRAVERPYNSVTFSQCIISLDNQLLVCCIANRILVYSRHDPDVNSSKRVLRGHLGRIEFCRFLKVNRYLISYGVDGMVFLWDINESKAAGFATIAQGNESIVSMAVSPEEDKVVCFTSSGRLCTIKLCGLGSALSFRPLASLAAPMKDKIETSETSLQLPEQIASTSQIETSPVEHDTTESLSSSDSEEYYLEDLDESD
ncbi:hypothetical protein OS493_013453 [Desmophyllum pertusum]|uniref:Uncharacterized protein n=1 Tax=Desmophyllum pertusum TaxID=174260 RepID=A0A9X0CFP6_9CNID|nr:hypothetical protein OS493_013453 [Desmophyllum pertusum]